MAFGNLCCSVLAILTSLSSKKTERARVRGAACCDHHDDDRAWTVSKNWILHVAFVHIQKTIFLCVFARKQIPLRKSKFCVFVFVAV